MYGHIIGFRVGIVIVGEDFRSNDDEVLFDVSANYWASRSKTYQGGGAYSQTTSSSFVRHGFQIPGAMNA